MAGRASGRRSVIAGERADVWGRKPCEARLPKADRNPPYLIWGLGGAAAGFLATTAARRVRSGPTRPLAPILLRQTRNLTFSWKP